MPLPISKNQLNKLGERLAAHDPPHPDDLALLGEVMRAYQHLLLAVERELSRLGLTPTARVKTHDVLIGKLRRERSMALAQVQDLAGARIVVAGGFDAQDQVVRRLTEHLDTWTGKPCRVVDRRTKPSHGYRAVHVVTFPDGVPIEVQVRTELQHYWAQNVEGLADRWGRAIRYGQPPEDADRLAQGILDHSGQPLTRAAVIDELRHLSEVAFFYEDSISRTAAITAKLERGHAHLCDMLQRLEEHVFEGGVR